MKKTEKTYLVQELIRRGMDRHNAHRIIYQSKGQAARVLREVLVELLALRNRT